MADFEGAKDLLAALAFFVAVILVGAFLTHNLAREASHIPIMAYEQCHGGNWVYGYNCTGKILCGAQYANQTYICGVT